MCFLVLENNKRPMKIHGEHVIAATLIPLYSDAVSAGMYISVRSGLVLEVKHVGLLADAVPESRLAYAAIRAIGATLSKAGTEAVSDDVYVPLEQSVVVQSWHGNLPACINWPVGLFDCWLPAMFEFGQEQAEGWFRVKSKQDVEILLVASLSSAPSIATIKPRYVVDLPFCITNTECLDEWETGQWSKLPLRPIVDASEDIDYPNEWTTEQLASELLSAKQ